MKKCLVAACMWVIFALSLPAANSYRIQRYNTDNGLPDNSVRGIGQDSYGLMWLCTRDGISIYDSHHFK